VIKKLTASNFLIYLNTYSLNGSQVPDNTHHNCSMWDSFQRPGKIVNKKRALLSADNVNKLVCLF